MWSVAIGAGIGLLLAVHGFAHWQLTTVWGSRPDWASWLLGPSVSSLGTALWLIVLLAFLGAGIGAGFHLGWWRTAAVAASVASLALMFLFWNPSFWMGAVADLGVLVGLLVLRWPSRELLGA